MTIAITGQQESSTGIVVFREGKPGRNQPKWGINGGWRKMSSLTKV